MPYHHWSCVCSWEDFGVVSAFNQLARLWDGMCDQRIQYCIRIMETCVGGLAIPV